MAYVSQELKKTLAPAIKAVLAKYGVKGTIAVLHHSTLVVNIKSGVLDLIGDYVKYANNANTGRKTFYGEENPKYLQVNPYYAAEHTFDENIKNFYTELFDAIKGDTWFDKSDIQSDYFHTAYYIDVNVGQWDKPYIKTAA